METSFLILPDALGQPNCPVHFYTANSPSDKNKVSFRSALFCFLHHGIKEVHSAVSHNTATPQDVLIISGGSVLMTERFAADARYEATLVFVSHEELSRYQAAAGSSTGAPVKDSVFTVPRDEFLQYYCATLKILGEKGATGLYPLKVQELLGYIAHQYPEILQKLRRMAVAGNGASHFKEVIEANAWKGLTLPELAFLCNMSLSAFKRRFHEVYGMPPQKYFLSLRMQEAQRLLAMHKRPSDIFESLGYESLSSFSNEFKKHYGVPPRQYLQKELPETTFGLLAQPYPDGLVPNLE